ncbi:MAG: LacI family DNA-binding transcriptional regulator [Peptococcaceae bacterium]|nr:LacI family DNA-binding transcriptional regulator [Peptococcaceae bacterium]
MSATIRDVATLANVSPSTVSRVIANNQAISLETAAKVRGAMVRLNYVPNANARSLAKHRTKTIALTIARSAEEAFANPFFAELLRGIASACQQRDYKLMLSMSSNSDWEVKDALQMVKGKQVDGLILSSVRADDFLVEALLAEQVPFVLIGRSLKHHVAMVNNDNIDCAIQGTRHLVERGRQRIAFISGPRDLVVSLDRIEGYRRALRASSRNLPELVVETSFTTAGGREAMARLASLAEMPDAIVAADDVIALGVIHWLKEHGFAIPADVAVIGFNDDPMSAFMQPALTTLRISTYALGFESARMLIDMLENQSPSEQLVIPAELIVRQTT